jgi:D-3-phosphoglycerate dehydrogenase
LSENKDEDNMTSSSGTSFPKDKIKVLLLENVHPSAAEMFAVEGFLLDTVKGALGEDELKRRISDVHILGIRSKTQVTPSAIGEAKRLLTLGCFCIGTNQVSLDEASARGVPVFNAPFSSTRSVAELVMGEVIMLARQLGDRSREVHAGTWKKVAKDSHEVRGKTLGIVGYGHIGSQVSVLAEAMGMRVIFYDVSTKQPIGNSHAVSSLRELLGASDFVTLHVPATPQTHQMGGAEELKAMRAGSYLLNASRGTVVQIEALSNALRTGHLRGAAVDVYPDEPEVNSDAFKTALQGLSNVILTPHIGGSTEEAQAAIGREVATSLIKFVNAGATTSAVNFPHVELPQTYGKHRLLNVHRNVPGVLRDINKAVSDLNANIHAQMLSTHPNIGYLVMDLDQDVSHDVKRAVAALPTSIRTRILY